jgi:signal transduction histidine kinase
VEQARQALEEKAKQLALTSKYKSEFLANMSHELRTPLNSLLLLSDQLTRNAEGNLNQRQVEAAKTIHASGNDLLALINDILDLSKIESGKLQLNAHPFDLRETVAMVERVMKGIAAQSGISIVTKVDPSLSEVYLDDARIKQVLLNLLSNAVKFSHAGTFVHLSVSRVPAPESPLACDAIRIEVEDHGIGIPPHELDKIFEEFYQVGDTRVVQKRGTGLGLALTRSFVQLHRGTIEVRSAMGEGSTFTACVPVDYRATLAPAASIAHRTTVP